MSWMLVTHIGFMGLFLFWNVIPRSYLWMAYVALGIFLLSHFVPLLSKKGGCRGGHDHKKVLLPATMHNEALVVDPWSFCMLSYENNFWDVLTSVDMVFI